MLAKLFNKHPILTRFLVFILLPIVVILFAVYWKIIQSIPNYSGEIYLQGISGPVQVNFDEQGTPTVIAQTDADAYFIQGYLHASERMWQMEVQRRTVQGRLSEVLGRAAFPTDIWMRTLGLRPSAEKAWSNLGYSAQNALIAYANGVNAWLAQAQTLPPEFLALDFTPEPWQPVDSLAWQKVLALNLGLNMYREIDRLTALKVIPPERLKVFYEHDPEPETAYPPLVLQNRANEESDQIITKGAYPFENFESLSAHLQSELGLGLTYAGSNAWAVSGQFTESGNTMLANDPHLAIMQNSPWYSIGLKGDKLDVIGMSFVGIPGVALGRNRDIAWGTTSLMSDQQDIFYLNVPVSDRSHYVLKQNGSTQAIEIDIDKETFHIKSDSPQWLNKDILPVNFEIRRTPMGPVVSDAVRLTHETVVLRWAALDDDDRSFEAFHLVQYADNWQAFRNAVSLLKAPGLHFIYADSQGNIGSQIAGHIPVRGKGVGVIPQRLQSGQDMWKGYVPFDQLPSIYNPQSGFVIAANSQIESELVISHEWASDARFRRIHHLLQEYITQGKKINISDMVKIQNDQVDLNSKALLPILTDQKLAEAIIKQVDDDERHMVSEALAQLSTWDAQYRVDSVAATIYEAWVNELKMAMFSTKLNPAWNNSNVASDFILTVSETKMAEVLSNDDFWCNSSGDSQKIPCQDELINSFKAAVDLIEKQIGSDDVSDWLWSKTHNLRLAHTLFSTVLEKPFTKEVPMGGAQNTINLALWVNSPNRGYQKSLGASFRQVFDLGKKQDDGKTIDQINAYVIPTGQSGHFLSKHYNDQTAIYNAGKTHYYRSMDASKLQNDAKKPEKNDLATLRYYPKSGG
ncbi:penicillin acylase family protein [Rheinheimera soli]|uniref:Penicillin amidase n=1 Tax=Rheinheimera soli TaxID=443616 RepID=A0ABU1W542_9GAMM|nr:penicillin acylase family protein [Rheinheimera soli]MDR7123080.1 penicillin amidase [Rheinheimera soli]